MLKLPKGLKKKKKGKKSKKDQELFTEEELAQYKREHQHHEGEESHPEEQHQQQQQQQQQQQGAPEGENDDEWRKFAALTTGIDSILKKTQGDLDRIKSTSFYQRAAPPPVKKVQEVKEEEKPEELEEAASQQPPEELDPAKKLLNAVVELSDSESESEVDDTAFDTTFFEKVEAGEIPVYYLPDEEEDLGPDPFDTGYAEKVIVGPEVSKRGKKIVNIGAAVEVLTGKAEASAAASKKRRQRRGIQNLLLESFELEQEEDKEEPLEPTTASPPKTILDEPAELAEEIPIDLSVSLHLAYQPPKEKKEGEEGEEILDEFDVIKGDDIFVTDTLPKQEADSTDWSEFELDRSHFPTRPPPPTRPPLPKQTSDDDDFDLGDDPFDTEYVEKIVPKPIDYDDEFDPRAGVDEDDEFNPRAEDENLFDSQGKPVKESLSVVKNDLLNTSHNDLASIAPTLAPNELEEPEEIDPFDTSAVDKLVQPGKTELKYLEKELLEDKRKQSLSDDDFDPRAEEEPRPSAEALKQRKSSLSLQVGSKLVSFSVPTPDLLRVEAESSSKIQKPLTPYYREKSLEEAVEEDPFDTSFVPHIAPTKVELDIIEKEILKQEQSSLKHSISDPDFDPRAVTPVPIEEKQPEDLYLSAVHDIKVLTPAKEKSPEEIEVDPFDTSIAANIVPGTTELRLLEDEFIEKKPEIQPPTDILSDTQDNSLYSKILTPQPTGSLDLDNAEDFDPFDTSFASNLAPGETEIKLIESEFIN